LFSPPDVRPISLPLGATLDQVEVPVAPDRAPRRSFLLPAAALGAFATLVAAAWLWAWVSAPGQGQAQGMAAAPERPDAQTAIARVPPPAPAQAPDASAHQVAGQADPPPKPAVAAAPKPRAPAATQVAALPRAPQSYLRISTTPDGAEVFREGRSAGRTPLAIAAPSPGSQVELELRLPGYEVRRVVLRAGEPAPGEIALRRLPRIEE
jgi:hypothetical protein